MVPCTEADSVRCCGVSSRSFIGMFGQPEEDATQRANWTDELNSIPVDSREQQSTADGEATTEAVIAENHHRKAKNIVAPTVMMIYPSSEMPVNRVAKNEVVGLGIPVQVVYASGDGGIDTKTETISETTETNDVNKSLSSDDVDLTPDQTNNVIVPDITLITTTNTPLPVRTTATPLSTTTSASLKTVNPNKFSIGKERRRPFRPASIRERSRSTDIHAEPEVPIHSEPTTATPSGRPWAKRGRALVTTTAAPSLTTSAPEKRHRLRLFNADNRLNYLRKKPTPKPSIIKEIHENLTQSEEPAPTSPQPPLLPIPRHRLVSRVDKEHRFMIEQVRFMLAQDTKRFAMVPVHSAFSTMAVAGIVPKPFMEDELVPLEPVSEAALTEEQPSLGGVTENPQRPFRGRKRFRFVGLKTRSTNKNPTPDKNETHDNIKQDIRTRTPNVRSNEIHSNQKIEGRERFVEFQRKTRRANDTDSEFEFPSAGPVTEVDNPSNFATWSEMFPPNWVIVGEPSDKDQYRLTDESDLKEAVDAPTTNPPSFLRAWSNFLPRPFWSSEPDAIVNNGETNDANSAKLTEDTSSSIKASQSPPTEPTTKSSSWFPITKLIPSPFWTGGSTHAADDQHPSVRVLGGYVSSSVSEEQAPPSIAAEKFSEKKQVDNDEEPNFSGLVTLTDNMQPMQVIGPIPKYQPPNDAAHIEFELPLETAEIVLI